MCYRIRRCTTPLAPKEYALLEDLEYRCFPEDDHYPKNGKGCTWWIIWDENDKAVGFGGSRFLKTDNAVFLCRAGVVSRARGKGLQRRLILVRLRHARQIGARAAMTYTTTDNYPSMNNLIRSGFTLWEPKYAWAGRKGNLYWWRNT